MTSVRFEWDERKSRANKKKHGISFEEAESVFYDSHAIQYFDDEHSDGEDRFIMFGMSYLLKILVVVHAVREHEGGELIRIISARRATKIERGNYKG